MLSSDATVLMNTPARAGLTKPTGTNNFWARVLQKVAGRAVPATIATMNPTYTRHAHQPLA